MTSRKYEKGWHPVNPDNQLLSFFTTQPIWFSYGEEYIQQILNTYYKT